MSRLDFERENWEAVVELYPDEPLASATKYAQEIIEGATPDRYQEEEDEPSRTDI